METWPYEGNAGRHKWSGARISLTRDRCDYRDFGLVELPAVGGEAAGHLLPGGGREGEPEGDLRQMVSLENVRRGKHYLMVTTVQLDQLSYREVWSGLVMQGELRRTRE